MGRDQDTRGERRTLGSSPGSPMATYQTRICDYRGMERPAGDAALSAYAELYGRVERKLFAEVAAGETAASLKSGYLKRYGIPARMFNGVRVSLEGKIASVREQQTLRLDSLGRRIARRVRLLKLLSADGGIRSIRNGAGWQPCNPGWRRWKPTRRRDGSGCASGRNGCGGNSTALGRTGTPAIGNGWPTGVMRAGMSSSCWGAGTRRRAASSVWPPWPVTEP